MKKIPWLDKTRKRPEGCLFCLLQSTSCLCFFLTMPSFVFSHCNACAVRPWYLNRKQTMAMFKHSQIPWPVVMIAVSYGIRDEQNRYHFLTSVLKCHHYAHEYLLRNQSTVFNHWVVIKLGVVNWWQLRIEILPWRSCYFSNRNGMMPWNTEHGTVKGMSPCDGG